MLLYCLVLLAGSIILCVLLVTNFDSIDDELLHYVGFLSRHRRDRDKKSKRQSRDKGYVRWRNTDQDFCHSLQL